jgi:hypothetical protein
MRIHQIIFLGFIVVAFVVGCIKAPRKMIGGVIGGCLGFLIPFLLAQLYVWRGGDPTAAGVFSFFCLFTVPLGIGIGVVIASQKSKERKPLDKDKV